MYVWVYSGVVLHAHQRCTIYTLYISPLRAGPQGAADQGVQAELRALRRQERAAPQRRPLRHRLMHDAVMGAWARVGGVNGRRSGGMSLSFGGVVTVYIYCRARSLHRFWVSSLYILKLKYYVLELGVLCTHAAAGWVPRLWLHTTGHLGRRGPRLGSDVVDPRQGGYALLRPPAEPLSAATSHGLEAAAPAPPPRTKRRRSPLGRAEAAPPAEPASRRPPRLCVAQRGARRGVRGDVPRL